MLCVCRSISNNRNEASEAVTLSYFRWNAKLKSWKTWKWVKWLLFPHVYSGRIVHGTAIHSRIVPSAGDHSIIYLFVCVYFALNCANRHSRETERNEMQTISIYQSATHSIPSIQLPSYARTGVHVEQANKLVKSGNKKHNKNTQKTRSETKGST